ncbi:MAG: methyltransferase domain-containing protein [Proteobacteria bacterium]|nr:methyltransferase domain-containing protein [Pseudomonadota bacterium]
MKKFINILNPDESTTILDVGGTSKNWDLLDYKCKSNIILLNIEDFQQTEWCSPYKFVKGDGRYLDYLDKSFDIAFSNSVIEHVGNYEDQKRFADEILRVGKKVWVQTPAKSFFVEPHLICFFIHHFPPKIQEATIRYFSLWGLITKPSRERSKEFLRSIRLLNYREIKALFPSCKIYKERFIFFTKSYIVVRL